MYVYIYVYACMYIYAGLKIGGVASQNANHCWGNYKSLWQSDSQNCKPSLADLLITFQMVSQKDPLLVLTPLLDEISPFLGTFYVYDAKMQIRCE